MDDFARRTKRLLEWLEKQRNDYADMVTDAGEGKADMTHHHIDTEELQRIVFEATPGPWQQGELDTLAVHNWWYDPRDPVNASPAQASSEANAALIALAPHLAAEVIALRAALGEQRQAAFEEAAKVAEEYSAENFRMATDSVVLDRAQRFENTEERQIEGNGHSAAGIAARNIAAAIRAASTPDPLITPHLRTQPERH